MRKACCKCAFLRRVKKEPGHLGRAPRFERCLGSELVAQSRAGDIDRVPDVEIIKREGEHRVVVGGPSEVVVQPFAPQEPAITTGPKLPFKSHPCNPAELVAEGRCRREGGEDPGDHKRISRSVSEMAPADASSAVEEPVGKYQIAKPAAGGSQLFDLGLSREGVKGERREDDECGRLLDVGAAEVNFQAADYRSPLPVVAELEAENATFWSIVRDWEAKICELARGEESLLFSGRMTPAAAAVDADIEADPIGNGAARDRRR